VRTSQQERRQEAWLGAPLAMSVGEPTGAKGENLLAAVLTPGL